MKLDLTWLVASNFKSFDKLKFDLRTYAPGLHFLRGQNKLDPALGSNGAGKSSVWDAVCWCLYGRTPSGLRGTDVKPWHSADTTTVTVLVNGKRVQRISPSKLTIDGKPAGQEQVDKLLGLTVDTFFHTVVLGQGQPLFFDLSPRDKLAMFSTVLQLDRWDLRADGAKEKLHRLEKLQARLTGELNVMTVRAGHLAADLEQLKQRALEWVEENTRKLEKLEGELKEAKSRIAKLQAEHDRADLAYDGAMMELKSLDKAHEKQLQAINQAGMEWEKAELKLDRWRKDIKKAERELEDSPDTCDKCGQPIGGKERKHMRQRLRDTIADLEDALKKDTTVKPLRARLEELRQEEARARATASGFREQAEKAKATLDVTTEVLVKFKTLVEQGDVRVKELSDAPNPHHEQLQKLRKERQRLVGEIDELTERLKKLSAQMERTKFWVKGFRDVRLYVVDALMQELEMATNAMLPEVGLADWQVRYDIERETKKGTTARGLNTVILSPDNEQAVKWEAWSGGEGQRLRVVGALAFADVLLRHAGVQPNLEVLDEPTQHLSGSGVRDLVEFLQARAKAYERAVFFIDHQAVESSHFDSVTTVVKDSRGSRVVAPLVSLSPA